MKLIKDNFYEIVRLYINQIGIAIFSLVLYTAVGMIDSDVKTTIKIVISVFAILFYVFLLYNVMWENGAKDIIKIEAGRMEKRAAKGFLMGLAANIPNFIVAGICTFSQAMFMANSVEAYKTVGAVFNLIMRLFMSMYIGVLQGIFAPFESNTDLFFLLQSAGFLLFPFVAILAAHFGYRMGLKNKKLFSFGKKK
jgi:hypothetical protein